MVCWALLQEDLRMKRFKKFQKHNNWNYIKIQGWLIKKLSTPAVAFDNMHVYSCL